MLSRIRQHLRRPRKVPLVSVDDELIIKPSRNFPYQVILWVNEDGTPVADIETLGEDERATGLHHDADELPYLRVWVNDGAVYDNPTPQEVIARG